MRKSHETPDIPYDVRYGSRTWKRQRLRVLNRDNWICRVVPDCTVRASIADHILPVYPGMPDDLFFGLDNLRASCRRHNWARGVAARLDRESGGSSALAKDYT